MAETPTPQSASQPIFDFEELAPEREALKKLESQKTPYLEESPKAKITALAENMQHPLYEIPPNASEELQQLQGRAQQKLIAMVEYMGELAAIGIQNPHHEKFIQTAASLFEDIQRLEAAAQESAQEDVAAMASSPKFQESRSALRDALGLKGEQKSFDDLLGELASPIQAPDASKLKHTPDMQAKLEATHQSLITLQYELLTFTFGPALRSLQQKKEFADVLEAQGAATLAPEEKEAVLKTLAVFVLQRRMYEARLQKLEPENPSKLYAYLGVGVEEIAEEFAEGSLSFSKLKPGQVPVLRFLNMPAWFTQMNMAAQQNLLSGFRQARSMLGTNAPKLAEVLGTIEKSPFGSRFWQQLLTIESPVTVALYTMHIHTSGNPLKATMDFAAFLATSAASGALLASATEMLAGAAIMAQRAKNTDLALKLLTLARLPKHPVIQFTAAIGMALGLAPVIDACTNWIDEQIPDGETKRSVNDAISIVSGSSIIDSVQFLWGESGLGSFDPETDATTYLSREVLATSYSDGKGIQSRKMNGVKDWNDKVDRAVKNETNPLMRKLHQLEYADYGGPWAQRRAFELYSFTEQAKQLQATIGAQLVERGQLKKPADFDLLSIATSDTSAERPDWELKRMEDDTGTVVGSSVSYIKNLDAKDELSQLWKTFRPLLKTISERVATYRHLQIYNKKKWLGEPKQKEMPLIVQQGIAAEVSYQMQRKDILTYREEGKYSKADFMLLATDVEERRAARDVPMKLKIADERSWPNIFTDLPGWLKRLQQHNDINKNVIDKVDRHFLERVLGSLKAESTQGKNAFRFAKISEQILAESQEEPALAMRAMLLAYAKTLPDADVATQLHPSHWWQDEYNKLQVMHTTEKDPIKRAELSIKMLETAANYRNSGAGGVPSLDLYKKMPNDMSVNTHVHLRYDVRAKEWYVDTTVYAEMPYIAISGLGSRHHFPKMNIRETVPFSEWRKDNPISAAKLAPEMIWHEKFITQMAKVADEDHETALQFVEQEKQNEKNTSKREAEAIREMAKKSPNRWHPYNKKVDPTDTEDKYVFDSVAYDKDNDAYLYMQQPYIETGPVWRSADDISASQERTIVRVVQPDGRWFQNQIVGNFEYTTFHHQNGKYKDVIAPLKKALSFPIEVQGKVDAKKTLMKILAVYVREGEIGKGKWNTAMEEALSEKQYFANADIAEFFFRMLNLELTFAAHKDKGTASEEWYYVQPADLRKAIAKARESTDYWLKEQKAQG